jgi:hypothetical protein
VGSKEPEALILMIFGSQGEGGKGPVIADNKIGVARYKVPLLGFGKFVESSCLQSGSHDRNGMKRSGRVGKELKKILVKRTFLHGVPFQEYSVSEYQAREAMA